MNFGSLAFDHPRHLKSRVPPLGSQSNIHSYNTRPSSRSDYYVKHSRLDKQTKSFSRYGVKIWNSLPCEMRQMSKNNFKINVHDTLLRILSEENGHIDLRDLITKIS